MDITKKRLIGYFATTLLVFAICVQVATAAAATGQKDQQAEIDALQTQINALQTKLNNIQLTAGPQGSKGDTGATGPAGPQGPKGDTVQAGSQVIVKTGTIHTSGIITTPDGYTIDQCHVILGLPNDGYFILYWPAASKEPDLEYNGLYSKITPTDDGKGFQVYYEVSLKSETGAYIGGNVDYEPLDYTMICVK
jgi:hypothetical protein